MSEDLVSVDQAAERLSLHTRTILRYIRQGRLRATRVGKSYRILQSDLRAFAGIASTQKPATLRTTAILDIPDMTVSEAERLATFLQAIALTGNADTPPLGVQTAYDPQTHAMKIVLIGTPADTGELLQMIDLRLGRER